MNVAFVVNDLALSGGVGVVVAHARQLALHHETDVTLVLARPIADPTFAYEGVEHLHVASLQDAMAKEFDVVASTWWETALAAFRLKAKRHVAFVQSLEDRFYRPGEPERTAAQLTYHLPVTFITEARWIRDTLADLRPDAACHIVPNGIDKDIFAPIDVVTPNADGPLRVLVEGYAGSWFKGVDEAAAAVGAMSRPHALTVIAPDRTGAISQREMADVYARTDVLVKLSRVEGMYGPPLEGFHKGATIVTTEVTGHDEYVEHGVNGLIVDWDDQRGTARALDLLATDRDLLHTLRSNALETAKRWPSWEDAGAQMATALRAIAEAPPPSPYGHVAGLMEAARTATEEQRAALKEVARMRADVEKLEWARGLPVIRQYVALRRNRAFQRVEKVTRKALGRGSG